MAVPRYGRPPYGQQQQQLCDRPPTTRMALASRFRSETASTSSTFDSSGPRSRASTQRRYFHRQRVAKHERITDLTRARELLATDINSLFKKDFSARARYVNELQEAVYKTSPESLDDPDFFEMLCKQALLLLRSDSDSLRAAVFHILRLSTFQQKNLVYMLTSHVDVYAVRALDIVAEKTTEREAAFELLAHMLRIFRESPQLKQLVMEARNDPTKTQYAFPKSIMQPVVAIALRQLSRSDEAAPNENDPFVEYSNPSFDCHASSLSLPCISLFLELAVSESQLILEMAGTDWIVAALTGTSPVSSTLATLISRVLVLWLDDPVMRSVANLHLVLQQIFAPLIEYGFFQTSNIESQDHKPMELPFDKYSSSFLAIMRSWAGIFACASVDSSGQVINGSPLRLLDYLGMGTVLGENLLKIRDMVVDIACEFVDRPYANTKFNTWTEAVLFYGKQNVSNLSRGLLSEDFILSEFEATQYTKSDYTNHMDFLIAFRGMAAFALISAGLAQSLARLIVAHPDDPSALKATLLLSDVCWISSSFVPSEWRGIVLSLPTLVQSAAETIAKNSAALGSNFIDMAKNEMTFFNAENAMLVLYRMDELTKIRISADGSLPANTNYSLFVNSDQQADKTNGCDLSQLALTIGEALNGNPNGIQWKAAVVALTTALRDPQKAAKQSGEKLFLLVQKIFNWLNPLEARLRSNDRDATLASKRAIEFAMSYSNDDYYKDMLNGFATKCFQELNEDRLPYGTFSTKQMITSGSAFYFALLGQMSSHPNGLEVLNNSGIMSRLNSMMNERTGLDYVKAVIGSLDYSFDQRQSRARIILQRALTATNEMGRKWCTRFLAVLANLPNCQFNQWGTKLLITQLGDSSAKVVRHAIRIILQFAPTFGDSLKLLGAAQLDSFGDSGVLMRAALAGQEDFCRKTRDILAAIRFWMQSFNIRYGEMVEEEMRIAMLGVRRTVSGHFARPSQERFERHGVRAHPHLLGELAKHETGKQLLQDEAVIEGLLEQIGDSYIPVVKGALLALGCIGRQDPNLLPTRCVPQIVRLAEQSEVLSVRGIAFFTLCLIGATEAGAKAVARLGWESSRHRHVINELRTETRASAAEVPQRPASALDSFVTLRIDRGASLCGESPCPSPSPQRLRSRSLASVGNGSRRGEKKRKSAPSIFVESPGDSRSMSPLGYTSPRTDRSLTIESFHGLNDEERKRTLSIITRSFQDDQNQEDLSSRSSTVNTGLSNNLHPKSQLEVEMENVMMAGSSQNEHFSTKTRLRWKLPAPRIRQFIQVFKSVGHPVRYNLMTRDQLYELGEYSREAFDDAALQKELELCQLLPPPDNYPLPFITLPTEIELICKNIFNMPRSDFPGETLNSSVEDRGAKSGHGRLRLDQVKPHDRHRCFFCTIPENRKPQVTIGADSALLRLEVLQMIDLLEIKRTIPEKRLLGLRRRHPWLFEWPCLYADVLEMLDQLRFKVRSRAFLQEIFYNALKL